MPGSPGAVTLLYSGSSQTGDAVACGSAGIVGARYDRWRHDDMIASGAYDNVRSGTVFAAGSGTSSLILFRGKTYWGSCFTGEFIQLTNAHQSAQWDFGVPNEWFLNVGSGGLIPDVAAMLVLQTQRKTETRVSLRDTVLPLWNTFTADNLPAEVKLKGEPNLTWTAFPVGVSYLSSNSVYLLMEQEIEIDFTDFWSNYAARFAYWIHLHLDGGAVIAHVQRWYYWVEAGAFASVIAQILEPNVKLGVFSLNTAMAQALSGLPSNVKGIYYLPGRQLVPIGAGGWDFHWQDTSADVTLVFET